MAISCGSQAWKKAGNGEVDEAEVTETDKLVRTFTYLLGGYPTGRTAVVLLHEDYPLELPTFGSPAVAGGGQKVGQSYQPVKVCFCGRSAHLRLERMS